MIDKVLNTIKKYNMFAPGESCVVALSGGADSVSLLHALLALADELGINIYAAHINHGIRGKKADADEKFVMELCERLDVVLFNKKADVMRYAGENKIGLEFAGRLVRYNFLNSIDLPNKKIAVGHSKGDHAETILMNIVRGCGTAGLGGIAPVRNNIARPLIELTREEIISFCDENDISYVTDESNFSNEYTRNRVRMELIPFIQGHFNPNIVETLTKNAKIISDENAWMARICAAEFVRAFWYDDGYTAYIKDFSAFDIALRRRLLCMCFERINSSARDLSNVAVERALTLIDRKTTGKEVLLGNGIYIEISYDKLCVYKKRENLAFSYNILPNTDVFINELDITLHVEISDSCTDSHALTVDFSLLRQGITVRSRRKGDRLFSKKLKDIFINEKITRRKRAKMPVVECDGTVLGVIGYDKNPPPPPGLKKYLVIECETN